MSASDYEAARERYEQANENWPKAKAEAAAIIRDAEDELEAAVANLRQYEQAPGRPLPHYRSAA